MSSEPPSSPDPSSADEAIDLFVERKRRGERVDSAEFVAQFAHLGPEIALAIETLAMLEHAGASAAEDAADVPERIGPYLVCREIGRGGMGVVLEAIEEPLGRRVALKVLPAEFLSSPSARARFRREAELAARLDHSGIATIYGTGVEEARPWIAMRFVEGETLAQAIARARADDASCVRLSDSNARDRDAALSVAAAIARVARALQAAHEQGVVHRDVKPSNVIVTSDGTPVLVDFGLAIPEDSSGHTVTRTGETAGTPAYIAPEIVGGERARPDAQSDVYALGVTLYECLTLRRPFEGPTPVALYRAILSSSATDVRTLNTAISRDLAVVAATAMERDRSRRYASAAALASDLEACVARRPIRARPVPLSGRVLRWMRREPRQAVLAGLLAATTIAVALFAGSWWSSRDEVLAAEAHARDRTRDDALVAGFASLLSGKGDAEADFVRVRMLDPQNLDALAGQALVRMGKHRNEAALEILHDAPDTPGFDALRSYCRRTPVRQDEHLVSQQEASALDFFLVGVALSIETMNGPPSKAAPLAARSMAMLDEAILRSPHARPFFHVARALVADYLGNERAARSSAGALMSLWPDSFDAQMAAGTALSNIDPELTIEILERAAPLAPFDPAPLQVVGESHRRVGNLEAAERWLRRALAVRRDAETYNSLGATLAMRECFEDAMATWRRGLVANPRHATMQANVGILALQLGDAQAAIVGLESALLLDPWSPALHGALGTAHRLAGNLEAARDHLGLSLALDPSQAAIWEDLARVERSFGNDATARACVAIAWSRGPASSSLTALREELGPGE